MIIFIFVGDMVITSDKYQTNSTHKSIFEDQMVLTIKSVEKYDLGSYRCIAKNSLGEVESSIRLYGKCPKIIVFVTDTGKMIVGKKRMNK